MPVFQNVTYPDSQSAKNCVCGDIELVQNTETGLVYNRSFNSKLMVYDKNYQNEQSLSEGFLKHLEDVSKIITESTGSDRLVEVGCGKGFFLEMLERKGIDVHGFDAAYEGNNPRIKDSFFDGDSGIKGKGIILRHVLEHIENPLNFLDELRKNNDGGGTIYIEVPCFDWICKHKTWFDICYEHVNYFRLQDLEKAFGEVISSGSLFNGQYIYIVADLASLNIDAVKMTDKVTFPDDFLERVPKTSNKNNEAAKSIIWGAATKGVIFSILSQRSGFNIDGAVDINPAKQNRYLPVSGIKTMPPEDFIKTHDDNTKIYVMNSNYTPEIKDLTNNRFKYIEVDGL